MEGRATTSSRQPAVVSLTSFVCKHVFPRLVLQRSLFFRSLYRPSLGIRLDHSSDYVSTVKVRKLTHVFCRFVVLSLLRSDVVRAPAPAQCESKACRLRRANCSAVLAQTTRRALCLRWRQQCLVEIVIRAFCDATAGNCECGMTGLYVSTHQRVSTLSGLSRGWV